MLLLELRIALISKIVSLLSRFWKNTFVQMILMSNTDKLAGVFNIAKNMQETKAVSHPENLSYLAWGVWLSTEARPSLNWSEQKSKAWIKQIQTQLGQASISDSQSR